ncbi:MAG TPA: hypothetical protein VIE36_13545 [Methylomirabilota bacterium]|jgi:hypothetical protein
MSRRILLALAAVALAVTTVSAQGRDVTGTIAYIDAATRTIHLTDGRSLRVGPGALISVDGREFPFEALRPGATVSVASVSPASPTVSTPPGHPPIDASGTVARVDRHNGIITLQDGRMLKLTDRTLVWQPSRIETLQPGAQVFVRNAQPVFASTPGHAPVGTRMGTVLSVDPANTLIRLDDGTLVRVTPATRLRMGDRDLLLSDLRRGDELMISTQPPVVSNSGSAVSALPREATTLGAITVDASEVQVVRRVQAP